MRISDPRLRGRGIPRAIRARQIRRCDNDEIVQSGGGSANRDERSGIVGLPGPQHGGADLEHKLVSCSHPPCLSFAENTAKP
jgi:hypothetical protein